MSFADSYIDTIMAADKSGRQRRVEDTIQQFGKLASQGDRGALNEIYAVDPASGASLEQHFAARNKAQAEWDDYVQDTAGRVAYSVLSAPAERRAQELSNGLDFMQGLTQRDPRLKAQVDRWRQLAASGDLAAIDGELKGVLDRSMSYADRMKQSQPATAEERALATLYPNDPQAQARALIGMKSRDSYINTPQGIIYRPGFSLDQPPPQAGAPAPRPVAETMPFAAATAPQGARQPQGLPGGATLIPAPPKAASTSDRIRVATEIKDSEMKIRKAESVAERVTPHLQAIDNGVLDVGLLNNMSYEAQERGLKFGEASPGAAAYVNLKAFLTEIVNGRLQLNVGVQTDGDAKRAATEILQNLGDTDIVRGRLAYIQRIIADDAQGQRRELENYKSNVGYDQWGGAPDAGGAGGPEMPADYGQERFAPLPDEPAAVPQAPPPAPAPSDAPPAPVGLYGQAKAGRAPVSDRLGPFARADVDAYALKHGLTTEQAFTILMARKRGER